VALKESPEELYAEINVTPLVDVVLVLLIIFMVTIPALIQSELPLELPEARTAEEARGSDLGIQIFADGTLRINGTPGSLRDLEEKVKALTPPVRAMVEADRRVAHGTVVEVLDTLRRLGVEKYAIAVTPGPSP
jgi:biopolymer transport protein ExbD